MIKHPNSHLDHGITEAQIHHIFERFAARDSFFIETITLPHELGTVPCGLYGPIMGDAPIGEAEVSYGRRGDRAWDSRLIQLPARQRREVTVIAGPHEEKCDPAHHWPKQCILCEGTGAIKHACILFTAFGGPLAPQEPGDVRAQLEALESERCALPDRSPESAAHTALYARIVALRAKRDASDTFWCKHALAK
jgi:hypothetical protein